MVSSKVMQGFFAGLTVGGLALAGSSPFPTFEDTESNPDIPLPTPVTSVPASAPLMLLSDGAASAAFASVASAPLAQPRVLVNDLSARYDFKMKCGIAQSSLISVISQEGATTIQHNLCDRKSDDRVPIASLTKWPSAIIIFQAMKDGVLSPDDRIPVLPEPVDFEDNKVARAAYPAKKATAKVSDLITHMLRLSSNKATYDLVVEVMRRKAHDQTLPVETAYLRFVDELNQLAETFEMTDTGFMRAEGLPVRDVKGHLVQGSGNGQLSTARDFMKFIQKGVLPFYDEFYKYETAPVAVDGVKKPDFRNPERNTLHKSGIFKTGTMADCNSYVAIRPLDTKDNIAVTIRLCISPTDRAEMALDDLSKIERVPIPESQASSQVLALER